MRNRDDLRNIEDVVDGAPSTPEPRGAGEWEPWRATGTAGDGQAILTRYRWNGRESIHDREEVRIDPALAVRAPTLAAEVDALRAEVERMKREWMPMDAALDPSDFATLSNENEHLRKDRESLTAILWDAYEWFEEHVGHDGAPDGGDPGWVRPCQEALAGNPTYGPDVYPIFHARLKEHRARTAALAGALEPFARVADRYEQYVEDVMPEEITLPPFEEVPRAEFGRSVLSRADFNRARQALRDHGGKP